MKILLLTLYFPPEIGAAQHLFYEMAEELVSQGHLVTVVTRMPRHNLKEMPEKYRGRWWMRESMAGFTVIRLWTPKSPRGSAFFRGLEHLLAPVVVFLGALLAGKQDAAVLYSPPLPLALGAQALRLFRGIPYVVNIQDLFPKYAIDLGVLKNPAMISIFRRLERYVYRKADHTTVHSPGNKEHVVECGAQPENVSVVHNWVNTSRVQPEARDNDFTRTNNLQDYFVVSYAGTLGWAQDMDVIIDAALRLREHKKIRFVIVGDGPEKGPSQNLVKQHGLDSVLFLPTVPWETYIQVLHASDVSLVNLKKTLLSPTVPSKLLNIMAVGRPVVASFPLHGDAPKIVKEAQAGYVVDAGDGEGMAEAILRLSREPERAAEMGRNGRAYVEKNFSRQVCVGQYVQLFRRLSQKKPAGRAAIITRENERN